MNELVETKRLKSVIGKNIRKVREMQQMSSAEFAALMELNVSHMGLIERGERGTTVVTLEKLSRIFNVSIDSLFIEHEDTKKYPA